MDLEIIYSKGIPLLIAPQAFSPERQRIKNSASSTGSAVEAIRAFLEQPEEQERRRIIDWVLKRRLLALGYADPRKPNDIPTWVPLDLFTSENIDWDGNAIVGNGLKFSGVKIVRPSTLAKKQRRILAAGNNQKKSGRPTRRAEIRSAYQSLIAAGKINKSLPQKTAIDAIRAEVIRGHPERDDKGLGEEAIRRVICEDFHFL